MPPASIARYNHAGALFYLDPILLKAEEEALGILRLADCLRPAWRTRRVHNRTATMRL
jgi:hypothetical protein